MELNSIDAVLHHEAEEEYDRRSELTAFDATKAGVKGLVYTGIRTTPIFFIQPLDNIKTSNSNESRFQFPVIDLTGFDKDQAKRKEIVKKIRDASESWGFFQIVNHGIPDSVLQEMMEGVHGFYEQDNEVKKQWYTRDSTKRAVYNSNLDLYSAPAANWRDSFYRLMAPNLLSIEELP